MRSRLNHRGAGQGLTIALIAVIAICAVAALVLLRRPASESRLPAPDPVPPAPVVQTPPPTSPPAPSGPASAPQQANAPAHFEPAILDLGEQPQDVEITRTVQLVNTSPSALQITAVRPSCVCVKTDFEPTVIQPGQRLPVNVTFETRDRGGRRVNSLYLVVEGLQEQLRLVILANVAE
jgi:hypothetical protein